MGSKLQLIHIALLGYVSILYPVCLIILSWICIELHDHNCQLLVRLWRPFQKCLVQLRRTWNVKRDIIDVFATFLILSCSKLVYQSFAFMKCTKLCSSEHGAEKLVMILDINITCRGTKHILLVITVLITVFVFSTLPALILIFYPVRIFRRCLTKYNLNGLVLITFIERFHGCYRDGLNGGRDMRSFAGFYLILRYLPAFSGLFHKLHIADWLYRGYLFSIAALLIAFAKPYKEKYMNVLDTLLLAHLSIVCHLLTRNRYSGEGTQTLIITLIPALLFGLLPFLKLFKMIKNTATVRQYLFGCCQRKQIANDVDNTVSDDEPTKALKTPTSSTIASFKTYGSLRCMHNSVGESQ